MNWSRQSVRRNIARQSAFFAADCYPSFSEKKKRSAHVTYHIGRERETSESAVMSCYFFFFREEGPLLSRYKLSKKLGIWQSCKQKRCFGGNNSIPCPLDLHKSSVRSSSMRRIKEMLGTPLQCRLSLPSLLPK